MKSNAQSTFYFSAYPLKALKLQDTELAAYNDRRKSPIHIKSPGKIRVLPMTNPYRLEDFENSIPENVNAHEVGKKDVSWFMNYE